MSVPRPAFPLGTPGAALIAAAAAAEAHREARLAAADVELGRPRGRRIADETRARATLIVETVLREVAALLRAAEPVLDGAGGEDLARRFAAAGLVARSRLGAMALARAEEHRLAGALGRATDPEAEAPGATAIGSVDEAYAAEAFAVREAEAARIDRMGDPLLPLHDLAAEDRHTLFWHVAACLAEEALAALGPARAGGEDAVHRAAAAAVGRTLASIDDGDGIARAAVRLAHALEEAGALDDERLAGTLAAGRLATLAGLLAVRGGIGFDAASQMIADPARSAVLFRAAGVERSVASVMVLTLSLAGHEEGDGDAALEAADLMDAFDALPPDRARAEVRRARLEPAYRDALAAIGAVR